MLSLYRHQRIETLATLLEAKLDEELRGSDAFYQPTIAVGSRAMERFVSEHLARRFGVASNLRFMRPAELIHRLVEERLNRSIEGLRAWDPSSLRFAILHELPSMMALEEAAFLKSYLGVEQGAKFEAHGRRALLLATDVADILDRLIHYRPDETRELREGKIPAAFKDDPAARFFQHLLKQLEARLGETHLLGLRDALERAERAPQADGQLHLFGLSYLPPLHLQLLKFFASERPIHAYLISPFEHFIEKDYFKYAEEDELSAIFHPLLAAWGSLGTDFLHRLHEDAVGADDHLLPAEPEPDHLLGLLRDDLRNVREPSRYEGDNWNIEIHSTYGMLRQVEALRERLLHLFSKDPKLKPRDIAILTPDPDRFGPLIEAVFRQEEPGLPSIPITLTDSSLASLSEAGTLLIQLFELANVRITLPGIASILDTRGLAARFGIAEDEQRELREILAMSRMRCHIDGDDPAVDPSVPLSEAHTIRAGLRRIILGSLMRDPLDTEERSAEEEIVHGYLPLAGLDTERMELVHQVLEAVDAILALIPEIRKARGLDEWLELVARIFDTLLPPLDAGAEGVLFQLGQLRLEYEASLSNKDEPLIFSSRAFAYELERRLDESSDRPIGRRGGVVVSRLTPMRALPFRVIALLGLDGERFPRRARHHALDLVAKKSRPGDRVAGREDRHLLFEALLAARERLMIFYNGRDATTNESIPPSVPVAELLDVLKTMGEGSERTLIYEHPLHPFSPRLFAAETPALIRTHSEAAYRGARALVSGGDADAERDVRGLYKTDEAGRAIIDIDLENLINFFRNPASQIARRRLRIALSEDSLHLEDREPLTLGHLESYQLRQDLLESLIESGLEQEAVARTRERMSRLRSASGEGVPHGLDDWHLDQAETLLADYGEKLREDSSGGLKRIKLEGVQLVDSEAADGERRYRISSLERFAIGEEILLATASSNEPAQTVEAWLLLAFTEQMPKRARVLYMDRKKAVLKNFSMDEPPSKELLLRWLRVYLGLDDRIFPLPPKSAYEVAQALRKGSNEALAMEKGDSKYQPSGFSFNDGTKAENIAIYRDSPFVESSPFYPHALNFIQELYVPMLESLVEIKKGKK